MHMLLYHMGHMENTPSEYFLAISETINFCKKTLFLKFTYSFRQLALEPFLWFSFEWTFLFKAFTVSITKKSIWGLIWTDFNQFGVNQYSFCSTRKNLCIFEHLCTWMLRKPYIHVHEITQILFKLLKMNHMTFKIDQNGNHKNADEFHFRWLEITYAEIGKAAWIPLILNHLNWNLS